MIPIEWSEEGRSDLFVAFHKAQKDMGALVKDAANPQFAKDGKKTYASLAAVLDTTLEPFHKNDLAVIQSPSFDGDVVTVETIIVHTKGGWLRSSLSMRPTKQDPQGVGSVITYARRYALLAIAGVAPEDDDGNAASQPRQNGEQPPARFSGAQSGLYRKSAAQAKRDGDHDEILRQLAECQTEGQLDEWAANFDEHTARLPQSWLDPISDEVEKRRNAILDVIAEGQRVPA